MTPLRKPQGERVRLRKWPELLGTVLTRGPEQSEVKWDNGNVTIVINEWMDSANDDKPRF